MKKRTALKRIFFVPLILNIRYTTASICMLVSMIGLLLFTSCKKTKDQQSELPVFGTCKKVEAKGNLTYTNVAGPYTFKTNGGGIIIIDPQSQITITHNSYPGFKIDLWGITTVNGSNKLHSTHESLNYKHIKDRFGVSRTFIFPDGAKLTLVAANDTGNILSASIYDGAECHHINIGCNTNEYSTVNDAAIVKKLDDAEPDGEAGGIEFTATGLVFVTFYTEDSAGNKVTNRILLGEIFRNNPTQVVDYFDDPRLAAT
jgi:hypothetical protein